MKEESHKNDYIEKDYSVVPDWVHEFREDNLSDGYVISRRGGEWIMTAETTVIDLERNR